MESRNQNEARDRKQEGLGLKRHVMYDGRGHTFGFLIFREFIIAGGRLRWS